MHTQKKKSQPIPFLTAKAHLLQFKSHPISIVCGCSLKKSSFEKKKKKNPPKIVWPCIKIHVDHLVSPIKTRVSFSLSCNWPKCRSEKNPFEKIVGVTLGEVSIWWAPLFCTHTQSRHWVFVLWSVGQLGGRKKKELGTKKSRFETH